MADQRPEGPPQAFVTGWALGVQQLKALLWRQWLIKSRLWGSTAAEVVSPILLMSMLVLAYGLVHVEHRLARVYAGDTAELLHNMTRDVLQTSAASDLQLCAAYLRSGSGSVGGSASSTSRSAHWPGPAVPGEVPCEDTGPGVRCAGSPCSGASCAAVPGAACVPFHCQKPVVFRGVNITQRPCSPVFVDPAGGDVVDCAAGERPPSGGGGGGGGAGGSAMSAGSSPMAAFSKAAAALAASRGGSDSLWQTLLDSGAVADLVASLLQPEGVSPERQAAFTDCVGDALRNSSSVGTTAVALQALQGFIDGNGPLPIPSFDEYIALHKALNAVLDSQPGVANTLRGARRNWGWNLLGNLLDLGDIAFTPASPEVLKFTAYMEQKYGSAFTDNFHGVFATEAEGEDYALRSPKRLWALVNFKSGPVHNDLSNVVIRMNYTTVPRTWVPVNKWKRHLSVHYKEYLSSGFLSIQSAIDGYVLDQAAGAHDTSLVLPIPASTGNASAGSAAQPWTVWSVPFPTAAYDHNRFYDAVGPMLGLLMALCLVYPLSMLIRGVVEEEETGARDLMFIQGLQPWVLPSAWAATYAAILTVVSVSVTIVCCASFLRNTQPSLLLVLLLAFSAAELSFGMLVASIFSRAKIAAIVGPLAHFLLLLPRYVFFRTGEPQALYAKFFASLAAPTAFTFAADLLAQYEGSNAGATWATVFQDPFPMAAILGLLMLDAKLYAALAWYCEQVLPGGYGPRQHWAFVLRPSYWQALGGGMQGWLHAVAPRLFPDVQRVAYSSIQDGATFTLDDGDDDAEAAAASGAPAQGGAALRVVRLCKAYGATQALQEVSFDAYAGQITALLGHNGAGKSSLCAILTGMLAPSSGDVLLAGRSVASEAGAVQATRLGLCPQRNVLFDALTVSEHLALFAAIRGMPGDQSAAAASMAAAVDLAKKVGAPAATLSGGMKRKLQVGIALLGSPAVVILDEPSSGMDAVARQELHVLLRRERRRCAMLLTTHFMDEADLLADSVAILAAGRLACHGPSLTLKERYGDGYTLTVTTAVDKPVDAGAIAGVVTRRVPGAALARACGGELVFRLSTAAAASTALPDLLDVLEAEGQRLGLTHWGISTPSLEEVFMRTTSTADGATTRSTVAAPAASSVSVTPRSTADAADGAGTSPAAQQPAGSSAAAVHEGAHTNGAASAADCAELNGGSDSSDAAAAGLDDIDLGPGSGSKSTPRRQAGSALWQQARCFREMMRKRALTASRDVRGAVFTLLLPVLAVAAVLSILKVNIDPTAPTLDLTLKRFDQQLALPVGNAPAALSRCTQPADQRGQKGYGVSGGCGAAGLLFANSSSNNSYALSQQLLQGLNDGVPPQYGALVFNDNITQHVVSRVGDAVSAAFPQLSPLNTSSGAWDDWRQQLGGGAGLAWGLLQASPEGRVAAGFAQRLTAPSVTLLHNGSSYHALPGLLSDLHEAVGALASGNISAGPKLRIQSHPLPLTEEEALQLDTVLSVLAAIMLLVPLCYLSGAYAIAPVAERAASAAHMQLISGCSAMAYWGGHAVFDGVTHALLSAITLAIFAAFGDEATTSSSEKAAATFLLLLCYGLAVIPLAYCQSFSFTSPSAAQVAIAGINFVSGFLLVVGSYVMAEIPETKAAQKALVPFARLLPPFNLGEGLIELSKYNLEQGLSDARAAAAAAGSQGLGPAAAAALPPPPPQPTVFAYHVLGRPLLLLAVEAAVFFLLVLLLERASADGDPWALLADQCRAAIRRITGSSGSTSAGKGTAATGDLELAGLAGGHASGHANGHANGVTTGGRSRLAAEDQQLQLQGGSQQDGEDGEVAAERRRVLSGGAQRDTVCLRRLHKRYGPPGSRAAVEDLCLGIRPHERFGFLGPNGAGKTTTLSILAGRQRATSGAALVDGAPAGTPAARAALGYCPQVDPLLGLLTGVEHLQLFLRLKGLAEQEVNSEAAELLRRVGLPAEMALRPAQTYSGGNKRKLSLAIALAGRPAAVLLDEPSSGMDPGARRAMWGAILAATQAAGVAVVLTTHSMEEVEVLCSRVGIVAAGRLACLGTPQRLKSLYGGSYLLEVFGADDTAAQAQIAAFAATDLGAAPAEAPAGGRQRFALPESASLATVFRAVEAARVQLGIQTYSLSQPTLEQVFVNVVGGRLDSEAAGTTE